MALKKLQQYSFHSTKAGSAEYLTIHAKIMLEVEKERHFVHTLSGENEPPPSFSRGTTQLSVVDQHGNVASMTNSNGEGSGYIVPGTGIMLNNMMGEDDLHPDGFHSSPPGQRVASMTNSNGEGSGYIVPGTGIMLNNMMGEDDLHPDGFHSSPPGHRVSSMMSPTLLLDGDKVELVIGSGGSKRIRTAITQVLCLVMDCGLTIQQAVDFPRFHFDGEVFQVEPGFSEAAITALRTIGPVNIWNEKNVYFGGVHAVIPGKGGGGDPRRGGAVCFL